MEQVREATLVERARDGDAGAAAELFERHWPRAWRIAFALTRDRSLADDAAQDAFIRAFTALGTFELGRPFRPWLDRIAARSAIDQVRTKRPSPVDRVPERADTGPGDDDVGEIGSRVAAAVLELEEDRRAVVVLRYWADLGIDEIASLLGVPAGTVSSRLSRALYDLRVTMEGETNERRRAL